MGRIPRWWWPVLWMASIFATSSTVIHRSAFVPAMQRLAPTKGMQQGLPSFWDGTWIFFVKGWHFTEYAILAFLLHRAIRNPWAVIGIAVAFAASDEFHQTFVADRGGLASDVVIDSCGALLATGIVLLLRRRGAQASSSVEM